MHRLISTSLPHRARSVIVAAVLCATVLGVGGTAGASVRTATADAASAGSARSAPVPSSGCAAAPGPALTNQSETIVVNGTTRNYLLTTPAPSVPSPIPVRTTRTTTPPSGATARPLVVDFHGLSEGATLHSLTSQFGTLGQKDGFVAVFPNGTGTPLQWNVTNQSSTNPDLAFITQMLKQIEATECIDTSRVYASGFSDGAYLVSMLACTMSGTFAAIGAVSGLQFPRPCHTTRPVPIITFHGTADPIVYFNGGVGTGILNTLFGKTPAASSPTTTTTTRPARLNGPGIPAHVRLWAIKDGCNPRAQNVRVSSQVILRNYICPTGVAVRFYIIVGGGHAWPASKFSQSISKITGFTTFQINATTTMWSFFQRFAL